MVLESLGIVKAAAALKSAAMGLAAAVPTLINNSAVATQALVTVANPAVTQGVGLATTGLAALGLAIAKGAAAIKTGLAAFGAKAATGAAASTTTAAKAATGAAAKTATATKGATVATAASAVKPPAG